MSILGQISSKITALGNSSFRPIAALGRLANSALNKLSFGRGLKIWTKPAIRKTKSHKNFHQFKLDNGLNVIFKKSNGNDIKTDLIINSGSAKDPKGKEGLAHFLEHIVCNHTKQFKEMVDDVLKINGGSFNAETSAGHTAYKVSVAQDKSELAFRLLAAFFSDLDIDEAKLEKEKGVISAEAIKLEAELSHKLSYKLAPILFGNNHAYCKPVVGNLTSINAIEASDLKQYYKQEYVPNNATLVISGDLDESQLKNLITRKFADYQASSEIQEYDFGKDMQASTQKSHVIRDDNLANSLSYEFLLPHKADSRKKLIATLISVAIAGGRDSRLYKKLIEEAKPDNIIDDLSASFSADKNISSFNCSFSPCDKNYEQNLVKIKEALGSCLKDIAEHGLSEREFTRIKNSLYVKEIYEKDSPHSELPLVYDYYKNDLDWNSALDFANDIKTITNKEVQGFVKEFLHLDKAYEIKVYGKGDDFKADFASILSQESTEVKASSKNKLTDAKLLKTIETLSKGISQIKAKLTALEKYKDPEGNSVYLKTDRSLPLDFISVDFPGGGLLLSKKEKLALNMAISMIFNGGSYNPRTKLRLTKQDLENLSIDLGAAVDLDYGQTLSHITVRTLSENYDKTLALLYEYLKHPAILSLENPELRKDLEHELEALIQSEIEGSNELKKDPAEKLTEVFSNLLYPQGHEFAQMTADEVIKLSKEIKLEDLVDVYKKVIMPRDMKITAVGDLDRKDIAKLQTVLKSINSDAANVERVLDRNRIREVKETNKAKVHVVDSVSTRPEALVMMGNTNHIKIDDPGFYEMKIANMILGQGMSSRLFENIREKHGLVYDISSSVDPYLESSGPFTIDFACDPRNLSKAIKETVSTVRNFLKKGVSEEELELTKSQIKRVFALHSLNSRESTQKVINDMHMRNKDEGFVNNFSEMIDSITKEDVEKVATEFIKPENFQIVVSKPKGFSGSL